jgi:hypothetical protein
MFEGAFLDRNAVDKCGVATIEIEYPELLIFSF